MAGDLELSIARWVHNYIGMTTLQVYNYAGKVPFFNDALITQQMTVKDLRFVCLFFFFWPLCNRSKLNSFRKLSPNIWFRNFQSLSVRAIVNSEP